MQKRLCLQVKSFFKTLYETVDKDRNGYLV